MSSLQSKILLLFLKATRRKRPYTDVEVFRRRIEEERKTIDHAPPASIRERCVIERCEIEGSPSYTLSPKRHDGGTRRETKEGAKDHGHVLYLHGGCYVFEITPHHWMFCAWLAETLGVDVTIPIYPLAPEHGVEEALRVVTAVYRSIASSSSSSSSGSGRNKLTIMGDSAGGGMALALAQVIGAGSVGDDALMQRPVNIVLLSPWLDVTMDNPDIPAADAADPWLSRDGLVEAGRMYRGKIDAKDHRVSPLHGDVDKLGGGRLSIFIGTRDVLLPDARLLARKTKARIFEYEDMVHDFMLIDFLPEAKRARADIASVLRAP